MQNVFSAANLKKYFSFIWGWRQWQESAWRTKARRRTKPALRPRLSPTGAEGYLQAPSTLSSLLPTAWNGEGKEPQSSDTGHTSAPSSSTPVSITVTYLSSIWTSSTVLSMWDLVPGSLLQGTHRWITYWFRIQSVRGRDLENSHKIHSHLRVVILFSEKVHLK